MRFFRNLNNVSRTKKESKILFEKWFGYKKSKYICLIYYPTWEKPDFWFHENGARKQNGDTCFDFNINFWKLHFSYTNWNLQHI